MSIKLTDTQLVLLGAAAQRKDLCLAEGRVTASQIAAASAASFFCRRIYGFT